MTRRTLLSVGGLAGSARLARSTAASTVAVARCKTYEPAELVETLDRMFDQIGGIGRIVKGKTVAIKPNLTGLPVQRQGHRPIELGAWTHPNVICAAMHLMDRAGAERVRILESPWKSAEPIDEIMLQAGWEPKEFARAAKRVEFENTN